MTSRSRRLRHAFTLIEMIGTLAVIAILASLLIPKIFEAINHANISQTALTVQTIKTAVAEHYAKYLSLASSNGNTLAFAGNPPASTNFDRVLLAEGLIDKPFVPKIGSGGTIQVVDVTSGSVNKPLRGAYDLDGDSKSDVTGANYVIEGVIFDVPQADAQALNDILDGVALGEAASNGTDKDDVGRVIYGNPHANGTLYEVHIYLTHH